MASRLCFFSVIWVSLLLPDLHLTQFCEAPERLEDVKMPEMFNLGPADYKYTSYKLMVEANISPANQTVYTTEYYDISKSNGSLVIEKSGQKMFINYLRKSNELFEYADESCKTSVLSSMDKDAFSAKYGGWNLITDDDQRTLIGPSNLIQSSFLAWKRGDDIGKEPTKSPPVTVRGVRTDVWTYCPKEGIKIQIYFSDPNYENLYGLMNISVPVRLTIEGTWNGKQFYENFEFVGLELNVPKTELDAALSIPFGVGCKRKTPDVRAIPGFEDRSIYAEAEMVYIPIKDNSESYTYISNFKIAVDQESKHFALQYSPWKSHKDAEMAKPGDNMYRILDVENGYTYSVDKSDDTCKIENMGDWSFTVTLPDGGILDLGMSDIFLFGANSSEYHYLGTAVERGIPANVFEKLVDDVESGYRLVVTRYHIGDDTLLANDFQEKEAPLKIVYWSISLDGTQFTGRIVMNFFSFRSKLTKKYEIFDVTPCFPEDSQSKWFQLTFPMGDNKVANVVPHLSFIQENLMGVLYSIAGLKSPLRIPKMIADVDPDNIYVTALLLERPPFLFDFDTPQSGKKLKVQEDKTVIKGLTSLENCAKACLEEITCPYFSYCGAICTVATSDEVKEDSDTEQEAGCSLYQSIRDFTIPTMAEVTLALSRAVQEKKIEFSLPIINTGIIMNFRAVLFKDEVAFGIQGLVQKPEGTIDERFSIFKYGQKLLASTDEDIQSLGKLTFSSCKQACINRESCQSFSHCLATSECFITGKHSEEIPQSSMQVNTQCMILNRNYIDYFERSPGISLAHDAEKMLPHESIELCSKACMKETSFACKSFDFCDYAKENGDMPCLLHEEHFSDFHEAEHVKKEEKCGHYSRKFVYDFKKQAHKRLTNTKDVVTLYNTSTEMCAKACLQSSGGSCQMFDFCGTANSFETSCTLAGSGNADPKDNGLCNVFTKNGAIARSETEDLSGHSKSATGGLAFLLFLIGLAVGVGGIFAFGYYKANKK